ncbi:extracellular lipase [Penicillium chermesinum]|uniref:Carboxylic ester hydrolase n=1 Tax=Penicillium chermesinum TaxID=63820 RepID=A0A9W9U033_9EURO|nr:extracellular lipase [Penicillium chermesinum]KAJ5248601.1 extracellular lipase [Penicillium chermesinum]
MPSLKLLLAVLPFALGAPTPHDKRASKPTVTIASPEATIVGSTGSNLDTFNGIPFALPPTGSRRLKPPQAISTSLGAVQATGTPPGLSAIPNYSQQISNAGEDCLTLNVVRPSSVTPDSALPVLVWIYGGGFEFGSTSMYNADSLVSASVDSGMPIIFVAMNYRLGGFGGDPDKVTIWGESAGSISVFDQMALYDGDHSYNGAPLFRGAIMDSGSITPADPVDCPKGQAVYDAVVKAAGCSESEDTLKCLRDLDYTTFLNAANSVPSIFSYSSIGLSYLPRPDGKILTQSPEVLAERGLFADVPFIVGDQEDEGTIFALKQSNITTEAEVVDYLRDYMFGDASQEQLKDLVANYADIATDGSPFRTGLANNWYPQFKRLAAILGDVFFIFNRRVLLNVAAKVKSHVPSWSYLASYDHGTPYLGTFHASDIVQVFEGIYDNYAAKSIRTYYYSFVYDLDPNSRAGNYMEWPQWSANKTLMNFYKDHAVLLTDDFREDAGEFFQANIGSFRG